MNRPSPGSHLVSRRLGYLHHGIYVGDGKVVHYASRFQRPPAGRVEETTLAKFARGRATWTERADWTSFTPQEVVRRARSRLGEARYRVLSNNCEHFCEWCLRGQARSYQVERLRVRCQTIQSLIAVGRYSRGDKRLVPGRR